MTQEEKAKAYDEAKARMSIAYNSNRCTIGFMNEIFPELKDKELTCKDIKIILGIENNILHECNDNSQLVIEAYPKGEDYYGEILRRFNNQRIKSQRIISAEAKEAMYGKPADDVEPKFKVGDWVVSPNGVYWHVDAIRDGRYQVSSNLGECTDWSLDTNIYHKFTIQDAKDGDVLVASDGSIFIFNSLDNKGCKFYVALTVSNKLVINRKKLKYYWETSTAVNPATKTQRDILAKAMLSLGYIFDFDKKELKKINSYCKEHCKGFQETGKCFADGDCRDKREAEQKSIWSEEDEEIMSDLLSFLLINTSDQWAKYGKWLKELKERIGG